MLKNLPANRVLANFLILAMVSLTALCVLKTPDVMFLKRLVAHSIQIMLLLLVGGLFFFIMDRRKLMFTAFSCVAALCLHFKRVADINLIYPVKNSETSLDVALLNTSDLAEDWKRSVSNLEQQDGDIICVVEVTPDWDALLSSRLAGEYPHRAKLTRIDIYGVVIFSRFPISIVDTIDWDGKPLLAATIQVSRTQNVRIYSFNTDPPLFRKSLTTLRSQLQMLAGYIRDSTTPTIVAGNFNLDQFADEIQDFRALAELGDSRRTVSPSLITPTNHIFFSRSFECLRFSNLYNTASKRMGILGEFQYKRDVSGYLERSKEF